jgi:hypothetical protein
MDIKEIVFKNELTQEEMEFVVEEYIFEKKNARVKINVTNKPGIHHMPKDFQSMIIQGQIQMLYTAYESASRYFCQKYKGDFQEIIKNKLETL